MKLLKRAIALIITVMRLQEAIAQDDSLKINMLQVIGSHNSYKQAIEPALYKVISQNDSTKQLSGLEYEHISITDQLNKGLRNLEIDVYADSKGGRYARPKGLELARPERPFDKDAEMNKPGFKVLHMPDIDFRTSVLTLEKALQQLRDWSDANPGHSPVFITLEPKDGKKNRFGTLPEPFSREIFGQLDSVILTKLSKEKLITPDMVRADHQTLEEAVLKGNWPTLKQAKNRFFFLLDNSDEKRDLYMQGHPSLKGRLMFVNASPGTPEAAAMFRNEPDDPEIPTLVKKGYIIRTRADANTEEARLNDYTRFNQARDSGAQIITTDYYMPSRFFDSPYHVRFEGLPYERLNPLNSKK